MPGRLRCNIDNLANTSRNMGFGCQLRDIYIARCVHFHKRQKGSTKTTALEERNLIG